MAVKLPVPPEVMVIPFGVADWNIWLPLNVSVFALNSVLISSINSTLALTILNKFLIFLFWKLMNLDSPVDIVSSVAKS